MDIEAVWPRLDFEPDDINPNPDHGRTVEARRPSSRDALGAGSLRLAAPTCFTRRFGVDDEKFTNRIVLKPGGTGFDSDHERVIDDQALCLREHVKSSVPDVVIASIVKVGTDVLEFLRTPTRVLIAQRGDNKCEITRARVRGTTARRYLRLFNIFTTSCVSHSRPFGSGDGRGARRAVIGTKSFSKRCRGWTEQEDDASRANGDLEFPSCGARGSHPEGLYWRGGRGDILLRLYYLRLVGWIYTRGLALSTQSGHLVSKLSYVMN
ncbi:hypothetical protein EVAR_78229_1 [Eumeta japonica]|uniref:Uncharacterized protein n=1 Tax=Eumeta variegata TaxID=151549 RepID=A0A4C1T3W5_EUMVA|nr:hypothetical protein EVAR_78229_1 [Eumeta japonica]